MRKLYAHDVLKCMVYTIYIQMCAVRATARTHPSHTVDGAHHHHHRHRRDIQNRFLPLARSIEDARRMNVRTSERPSDVLRRGALV